MSERAIKVIRLGFEPKTHSLEGCCSIQLSYRTDPYVFPFYRKVGAKVVKNFVIASGRRLFLAICYHLAAIFYAENQRETDDSENHSASDLRIDRTSILVYDSCCHLIACQSLSDIRVL